MNDIVHVPVLLDEVVHWLRPKQNGKFIDGTVGQGGHAEAILERTLPDGHLLAIDRDPMNLAVAKKRLARFGKRVDFLHASYSETASKAYDLGFDQVDGILLDLGFSSAHIEDPTRGFSFQSEGPLDMRYDPTKGVTAEEIVATWSEGELAKIFRVYGEEEHAREIAEVIVSHRQQESIKTTLQLAELVASVIKRHGKTHPATRVFQALRIAVNDELGQLERALPSLVSLLKPGGRLAVISFHSLEDRVVKHFFASENGKTLHVLTKHVVVPSDEERRRNPRARSAKLRVAEKL